MFKGVSKETKVGALAAIAITVLILGYNYMVGKDNPLSTSRQFFVIYDSAQGLADNTALMFNGFRIGQLKKQTMDVETGKVIARIEVYNEIKIPSNSRVKIESAILGSTTLKLVMGNSKKMALDGDTLLPDYTQNVMSMVNEKIAPIASGADSLLNKLNSLIGRPGVKTAFDELPVVLASLNEAILEIQSVLAGAKPGIQSTMNNVGAFSSNLSEYNKSIKKSLMSFERAAGQLDSVQLAAIASSLQATLHSLEKITKGIEEGKGTLGQLATDDSLMKELKKTNASVEGLLQDIKKYPEKYLPLPWGKHQRNKAKKESEKNSSTPAPGSTP
jgi:phospholipid/cholesterol/gamma-HCH transport system substrate-binding protein